jgi:hypothetical protein
MRRGGNAPADARLVATALGVGLSPVARARLRAMMLELENYWRAGISRG